DVHQQRLDRAPDPEMYIPLRQFPVSGMVVMVRTAMKPSLQVAPVRQAVEAISSEIPIASIRPLTEVLDASMSQRAFFAGVLTFFGGLALLLGAVGVYGVMAYAVGERRHEFGIRMALGATGASVVRCAMATGAVPLGVGLLAGFAGVVATSRMLRSLLFDVSPFDPLTLGGSPAVLLTVALLAVWIPSRRASQVAPSQALRSE
ncbi:MAG: FtsX-like permease family protein, partial [Gemmatimonadota bacterium]